MASLPRRRLLAAGGAALALSACNREGPITAAHTPRLDMRRLNREVGEIAGRIAPGALGAGVMNLDSAEAWTFNGARPFPLQSVFKAALGAAVLAEADDGRLSLDEPFSLRDVDLSPPWSPVADAWPARRDYTARELLTAAVSVSDNTAADVLMARIGGPGAVTAWLNSKRIQEVRIDRYERDIQTEVHGLAAFRAAWKGEPAFRKVVASLRPETRRRAMEAYLADPRDTATPRGMLHLLHELEDGELIAPASRRLLLRIMTESKSGPARIKAGLPQGSILAHKTGTGPADLGVTSAINDAGIFTLPDKRRYAIAVFVAGARLAPQACEAVVAEVTRAVVRGVR
jgi:beta-lactamase class A